jgi:hypothetical protein
MQMLAGWIRANVSDRAAWYKKKKISKHERDAKIDEQVVQWIRKN